MFGSNKTATTSGNTANTGFLSRLRSGNKTTTTKTPVYKTGNTSKSKTGITKRPKKSVGTGPAPMSHHQGKPTLSQKVHGAATVLSGKMHNDHREVRAGEKEMQGQTPSTGVFSKGSHAGNSKRI